MVAKDPDNGECKYAMVYLDTVRSLRSVGDNVKYVKHDHPLIMSFEPLIAEKFSEWKENDIVFVKGVVTTKKMHKTSYCPECKDDEGNATKNDVLGNLVYVTPIYVNKVKSYGDNKAAAIEDVVNNREISNQMFVYGRLLREPKFIHTKYGLQITQYPIAINRKYTIRTDDPIIKADWPIVKSYGEQAIEDRTRLKEGSEVMIDGFLQARAVKRKIKCSCCGKIYDWKDRMMEIVPYAVEYYSDYLSDEDIEKQRQQTVEEYKQMLFSNQKGDKLDDDLKSDDIED
jgi:hypothetical protein